MRECCSDSEQFISICKDLQEHGRHPKSLQDSRRHHYCVPRCVPHQKETAFTVRVSSSQGKCLDRTCGNSVSDARICASEGTMRIFLCDLRYALNAVATANTSAPSSSGSS